MVFMRLNSLSVIQCFRYLPPCSEGSPPPTHSGIPQARRGPPSYRRTTSPDPCLSESRRCGLCFPGLRTPSAALLTIYPRLRSPTCNPIS